MDTSTPKPVYHRVLIKLSGEALQGELSFGLDPAVLQRIAQEIVEVVQLGVQVGVVVGAGNMFRGATLSSLGLDRVTGDQMAMLATVINALAIRDAIEKASGEGHVMSAIPVGGMVEQFNCRNAEQHLNSGRVLIFAAGTGNPLVTTDSAASLRAIEIKADILFKATNVDGIYSADPKKYPDAQPYSQLTYNEVLEKELGVMDLAAFCQCREFKMPLRVFNINKAGALLNLIKGGNEGTIVKG